MMSDDPCGISRPFNITWFYSLYSRGIWQPTDGVDKNPPEHQSKTWREVWPAEEASRTWSE